jgi:hypothetical protein
VGHACREGFFNRIPRVSLYCACDSIISFSFEKRFFVFVHTCRPCLAFVVLHKLSARHLYNNGSFTQPQESHSSHRQRISMRIRSTYTPARKCREQRAYPVRLRLGQVTHAVVTAERMQFSSHRHKAVAGTCTDT